MRNLNCLLFIFIISLTLSAKINAQQSLDAMIDSDIASLVSTYKNLHAAPELSHREEKTSVFFATQLKALGYTVNERIGKFERPEWQGYGVVAVMRNGTGPTVLVRSDLDALPVEEKTELPYASKVRTKNDAGQEVGVMHACGHDIHMTSLLGAAKLLAQLKDQWSGTLVLIGQPAEETIDGARAMLRDDLYTRFPRPDFAIALHDTPDLAAGMVGYTPAYTMASSTNIDIKIRGLGGHGSKPPKIRLCWQHRSLSLCRQS
ncbi:MAG: amidohydrolase [Pyrinomonadaceae bacterium]